MLNSESNPEYSGSDSEPEMSSTPTPISRIEKSDMNKIFLGMFVGLIAAVIGAFLFKTLTQFLGGDYYYVTLIPLGWFGGFGFGFITQKNESGYGLIGCVFGIIAMLMGLWFVFTTPVPVYGYTISASEVMPFGEWLDALDYICILVGIVAAYFGGKGMTVS